MIPMSYCITVNKAFNQSATTLNWSKKELEEDLLFSTQFLEAWSGPRSGPRVRQRGHYCNKSWETNPYDALTGDKDQRALCRLQHLQRHSPLYEVLRRVLAYDVHFFFVYDGKPRAALFTYRLWPYRWHLSPPPVRCSHLFSGGQINIRIGLFLSRG